MKKFLRIVFDFIFAFGVVGYVFSLTFGTTAVSGGVGFNLTGIPALVFFGWLVFYFWGLGKMGKKTLGKMIFQI